MTNKIKIKFLGLSPPEEMRSDLLLSIIGRVSQREVRIVESRREADLIIVHPYIVGNLFYKLRWVINLFADYLSLLSKSKINRLRWMLGVGKQSLLVVSHENLDRPYWWNMIGKFLIESDIPRLTYWPREVDPVGARFPYWYNYVDWPQYPRQNFYHRFGRLYKIEELMAPLSDSGKRKNKALAIASHLDHPRKALLKYAEEFIEVDCYGASGIKFDGSKIKLMQQYKYTFCPENSSGYGYDTEKLPEAWAAGCIPLGYFLNPFSDFNPKVSYVGEAKGCNYPLLLNAPSLAEVEEYIRGIL